MRLAVKIAAVVAGNSVPLLGVYVWGWHPLLVVVIYWVETVIIGLLTTIKLLVALRGYRPQLGRYVLYRQRSRGGSDGEFSHSFSIFETSRLAIVPLFVLVYGGASGMVLLFGVLFSSEGLFGAGIDLADLVQIAIRDWYIWAPLLLVLVFDHAVATTTDYLRGPQWARSDPNFHAWRPMGRFFLFFALIMGAAFLLTALQTHWLVIGFVALKLTGELFAMPFRDLKWEREFKPKPSKLHRKQSISRMADKQLGRLKELKNNSRDYRHVDPSIGKHNSNTGQPGHLGFIIGTITGLLLGSSVPQEWFGFATELEYRLYFFLFVIASAIVGASIEWFSTRKR